MRHYLFTRFNLYDRFVDIYNHPEIPDPEEWMNHRIALFETFTLPSIERQTCRDFTWLLAFSKNTPPEIPAKYRNRANIRIIYEYPPDWLGRNIERGWIATSRLDNDDYVHSRFMEIIQGSFAGREEVVDVDYEIYNVATHSVSPSNRNRRPDSPFLSLFEKVRAGEPPKTCFFKPHYQMPDHFSSRKIESQLAMMVVHGRNLSN